MHWARCLCRGTEKGWACGQVSAKALTVLEALLWAFHNARSGLCFPSYETIRDPGLPNSSKSDFQTGTPNQEFFSSMSAQSSAQFNAQSALKIAPSRFAKAAGGTS